MITAANSQTCVTGQKFKNIMCVCVWCQRWSCSCSSLQTHRDVTPVITYPPGHVRTQLTPVVNPRCPYALWVYTDKCVPEVIIQELIKSKESSS